MGPISFLSFASIVNTGSLLGGMVIPGGMVSLQGGMVSPLLADHVRYG